MADIVVITGASRGIGRATALLAARHGFAVAVGYRRQQRDALAVVAAIEADGGRATAVQVDVSVEADVARLFDCATERLGPVTALVNNAGIIAPQARLESMTVDRWRRVIDTNLIGSLLCCREAIRRCSTRHGGHGGAIVNVSSVAATLGAPGEYVDYAATKGAIDTLTVGLAREVAADGIRVNAVRPGVIYTDLHADGGEPGRVDRVKSAVPLQRGGMPDEVAAAIVWLLSPAASYVTGALLDVSGGR